MIVVEIGLLLLATVLAVPTTVLVVQCLLGALAKDRLQAAGSRSHAGRAAVLVPAHNEETGIVDTLTTLRQQLGPEDRLLVVADNCTDQTASIARASGAEVVERFDSEKRGKGYALSFGFEHLSQNPPDVVVIVDADCQLSPGAIGTLVDLAISHDTAVQGDYTMTIPAAADLRARVSALAFRVRNRVRTRGFALLGLPCHLGGSGMAFPWAVLKGGMPLGDDLAEDLLLGIKLAMNRHFPMYVSEVRIESELATSRSGQTVQRQRWEQGHMTTVRHALPRLLRAWWKTRDFRFLGIALDVGVPPLTLHVLMVGALFTAGAILAATGGSLAPLIFISVQSGLLLLALGIAWARHGRDVLPGRMLIGIPLYLVWKVPMYLHMLVFGGARGWVRTDRSRVGPRSRDEGAP